MTSVAHAVQPENQCRCVSSKPSAISKCARDSAQTKRVRAAIDVLINHGLVHVVMAEGVKTGHPYNHFQLLGFTRESHDDPADDRMAASDGNAV